MAYKASLQSTGNPDVLATFQHDGDFFPNQSRTHQLSHYDHNNQRPGVFHPYPYNLSARLQHSDGVSQVFHLSDIQIPNSMNYHHQIQYRPDMFNYSQYSERSIHPPKQQLTQNAPVHRSPLPHLQSIRQVTQLSRHDQSHQFAALPLHAQTLGYFQQTLQVPQGFNQQNQQIPLLHNQQYIPPLLPMHSSAHTQSHQQPLKPLNIHQHHNPENNSSNADLTQYSQGDYTPTHNVHRVQAPISNFGHTFHYSSPAHASNGALIIPNRTASIDQNSSTAHPSIHSLPITDSSNLQQNDTMSIYSQRFNTSASAVAQNQYNSSQGLRNTNSPSVQNPNSENRNQEHTHTQYSDSSNFLSTKPTTSAEASAKNINTIDGCLTDVESNINGHAANTSRFVDGRPTNLESSINGHAVKTVRFIDGRPEIVNRSVTDHLNNFEKPVNGHPTQVERSVIGQPTIEKTSINSHSTNVNNYVTGHQTHVEAQANNCETNVERSVNSHPTIVESHSTNPYSVWPLTPLSESNMKGDGRSVGDRQSSKRKGHISASLENTKPVQWYKRPGTTQTSSFQSDIEAMQADTINYVTTTTKRSNGTQHALCSAQIGQKFQESQNRFNHLTSANKISTNMNSSRNEEESISTSSGSDGNSLSKNTGTETSGTMNHKLVGTKSSSSTVDSNKITDVCTNSSSVIQDMCINLSVSKDNVINNLLVTKSTSIASTSVTKSNPSVMSTNTNILPSMKDKNIVLNLLIGSACPQPQETDSELMKNGVPQDKMHLNRDNVNLIPAVVHNRRHTSPGLSEGNLSESRQEMHKSTTQRPLASRYSLDTHNLLGQVISHSQEEVQGVVKQNISNQEQTTHTQNISIPRLTKAHSGSGKKQPGSCLEKVLSAKEKVYNMWKSGHVIGNSPHRGGRTNPSNNPILKAALSKNIALKEIRTLKKNQNKVVPRTPTHNSTSQEDVPCTAELIAMKSSNRPNKHVSTICYVMFHGHKLICLNLNTEALFLLCQFQGECFPDIDLENVINSIDQTLQIKKKGLDHPEKEKIIRFLKKSGYILDNLVQTISLDEARKIYHHVFEIPSCLNAACVVELVNSAVDLSMAEPPFRKTLTREVMLGVNNEETSAFDKSPQKKSNAPVGVENCQSGVNLANDILAEPVNLQQSKTVSPPPLHHGNPRSDHTVAHEKGRDFDDPCRATSVETFVDPHFICSSPGTQKVGGLCNTYIGQIRSYMHGEENFLVVDDLSSYLGTTEFYHFMEKDNIILYSCCQEIANFLNSISLKFPPLKSLHHSLVKVADVGVFVTDNIDVHEASISEQDGSSVLKRLLCKMEVLNDDCSSPKQTRLDDGARSTVLYNLKTVKQEPSFVHDQGELTNCNTLQKGICHVELSLRGNKESHESDPDFEVAGTQREVMMIQSEASARDCNQPITVMASPGTDLSVQHKGAENSSIKDGSSATIIDALDSEHELILIKPLPRDKTVTTSTESGINNIIMVFDKGDVFNILPNALNQESYRSSSSEHEGAELLTRTTLSLPISTLSKDIESASFLSSSVQFMGSQRSTDDINVMTSSSIGMFVPICRRESAELWQQIKVLQGKVYILTKHLALAKAAHEKSDKLSKYYEDVIHLLTSTYKDGDQEPN